MSVWWMIFLKGSVQALFLILEDLTAANKEYWACLNEKRLQVAGSSAGGQNYQNLVSQ